MPVTKETVLLLGRRSRRRGPAVPTQVAVLLDKVIERALMHVMTTESRCPSVLDRPDLKGVPRIAGGS